MNKDEQQYVNELKREIEDLEDKLKFMTEERDTALLLAQKYVTKYSIEK